MTQVDRPGASDPVSVPFTPGMRDNPEELAAIPDEIARAHELLGGRDRTVRVGRVRLPGPMSSGLSWARVCG